jgi:H+/Cl- antiporter ClcA
MKQTRREVRSSWRLRNEDWHLVILCMIVGLVAGTATVIYRFIINSGTSFARSMYACIADNPILIVPWVAAALVGGYIIHMLIVWEPTAAGSGIPQVKGYVSLGLRMRSWHILISRFIGGTIGGFFGVSVGREGPSVHIGSASGKLIADRMRDNDEERRCMVTGGAAAGISAAFNAPLSGIVFALEEVHHNFSAPVLLSAMAAAMVADIVSSFVFGLTPVLDFVTIPTMGIEAYYWIIPVGLAAGLLGALINYIFIHSQNVYARLPSWAGPAIAICIALPVGIFMPDALGGGENLVKIAEHAEIGIASMALLLAVKIVFTGTSFGSGIPGGIFMPILAIGALCGATIGLIAVNTGMPSEYVPDCAVICMAGTMASSVRAPVTAILLTTEMTGSLIHLLPLTACVLVAYLVSGLVHARPIYDVLLDGYLSKHPDAENESGEPLAGAICSLPR